MATSNHDTLEEAITALNDAGWFSNSTDNNDGGLCYYKEGSKGCCVIAISRKNDEDWNRIQYLEQRAKELGKKFVSRPRIQYTVIWWLSENF